jgi:hypothetical protein
VPVRAPDDLDLSELRHAGELIGLTLELFRRHAGLFLTVTLLVVAPFTILFDGVWAGALRDGPGYSYDGAAAETVWWLLTGVTMPALITSLHAVIVRDLGAGRVPSTAEALRAAAPRMAPAVAVVALFTVAVAAGLVVLVVPGIWIAVRWYFGAQVVVIDGAGPVEALRRSAELVRGRWWSTFGALLLSGLAFTLVGTIVGLLVGVLFGAVDVPALYVAAITIVQAVALSLTALFGTLLFFLTRAQAI